MKYLFKLKKDGEKVGYLKIEDGAVSCDDKLQVWDLYRDCNWIDFNKVSAIIKYSTAHPFVTKDKNGKDVFAEDKIQFLTPTMMRATKGVVLWYETLMNWIVEEQSSERWSLYSVHDIELIEEEK